MRKISLFSALIVIAFVASGCGSSDPSSSGGSIFTSNNRVCTSEYDDGATSTFYTDGERMRTESSGLDYGVPGMPADATYYTIFDGEWTYTWDSVTNEGTKFPVMEYDEEEWELDDDVDWDDFDVEMEMDDEFGDFSYSCKKWNVKESMFVPPSDIVFDDFSDWMMDFDY